MLRVLKWQAALLVHRQAQGSVPPTCQHLCGRDQLQRMLHRIGDGCLDAAVVAHIVQPRGGHLNHAVAVERPGRLQRRPQFAHSRHSLVGDGMGATQGCTAVASA